MPARAASAGQRRLAAGPEAIVGAPPQPLDLVALHRRTEQEALAMGAAGSRQPGVLLFGLETFGDGKLRRYRLGSREISCGRFDR